MSDFTFVHADELPPADLHAAFASAFSDYLIGPFTVGLAQWPQFLARHAVDLPLSRAAARDNGILAFAFVAPRSDTGAWRLATMGAVPQARGSGAAPALLDDFIERASAGGACWVELECFAQNERALRLYRSRGFEVLHPLHGYVRPAGGAIPALDSSPAATDIDREEAFGWLDAVSRERGDLPLQVTPVSLRATTGVLQVWHYGSAQLAFVVASADAIVVQSLVDTQPAQQAAQVLAMQLVRRYPQHRITVPQLQRPDLGGDALERLGFERQPLHQFLMRRTLA